jgi:hypothetical protein
MDDPKNTENVSENQKEVLPTNEPQATPEANNQEVTSAPTPKRLKKPLLLAIVVLLLMVGGAVGAYYWHMHKPKPAVKSVGHITKATTVKPSTVSDVQTPFLTYVSQSTPKSLLVTNAQQKTLATLTLPSNMNTFAVLANNGRDLLAEEAYITNSTAASGTDYTNAAYYLVSSNGKSTELSSSVTNIFRGISGSTEGAYFSGNNSYAYVGCAATSCSLSTVNLSTAATTNIFSTPYTPQPSGPSLSLLGVSTTNIAYLLVYPPDHQGAETIIEVNLNTKAQVKTFPMANQSLNPPNLSNNFQTLIYTPTNTNGDDISLVADIMDLSTGKTTAVNSSTRGATYVWSPDSTKAAIMNADTNGSDGSTATSAVAYVGVSSAQVVVLKNYGNYQLNNINIDGWASATQLNYDYTQTTTANYFPGNTTSLFSISAGSGTITPSPAPSGYKLIMPQSN